MSEDQSNTEGHVPPQSAPAFDLGGPLPPQQASPPQVYDWNQVPAAQRSYSPAPDPMGGLIPTSNPPSLWSYYCGIFSLTVCFSPILAPIAILQGRKALSNIKESPGLAGKAHAIVGIVTGSIGLGILLLIVGTAVLASMTQP
jgi:hypothetical protein